MLVFLHHLLLQAQRDLVGDLTDEETLDIVSNLARTYETLSKGIVYEHQSDSPRLQTVISWLGKLLSRRREIAEAPGASDTELLESLQSIVSAVKAHLEQSQRARSYLDTAAHVFRASLAKVRSIQIPGQSVSRSLLV